MADGLLPPSAVDIEKYALGAVLMDNTALDVLLSKARGLGLWHSGVHQVIWEAMLALHQRGAPLDLLSVHDELAKRELLEKAGGAGYLAEISSQVPSAANIEYHAEVLVEKAMLRRTIQQCQATLNRCFREDGNAVSIIGEHESALADITERTVRQDMRSAGEILPEIFERMEDAYRNPDRLPGVSFGLADLNERTGGLLNGNFIIIAARPGHGKTAFALNIARTCGVPVGFFSIEMDDSQLAYRLLSSESQVVLHNMIRGKLEEKDWAKLTIAGGKVSEYPIYIDDTPNLDIMELEAKAKQMVRRHGVKAIVVDYLQQITAQGRFASSREKYGFISGRLNGLKKKLNIPVVALSQLTREVEKRSKHDRRPRLSDLRETGDLEQDADMVMFIYRPELYDIQEWDTDGADTENTAEIIIAKQRQGPIGSVRATFLKEFGIFLPYSVQYSGEVSPF